jgi:oligopeptide transport system ATP-binding protein
MKDRNSEPILRVENLVKFFPIGNNILSNKNESNVQAVNNVSFNVYRGETLGLVGESGCGKTTLGRTLIMLYKPTSGNIFFNDEDLTKMDGTGLRKVRRSLRMVFQDPYSSLDPRMTVTQLVSEPLRAQGIFDGKRQTEL